MSSHCAIPSGVEPETNRDVLARICRAFQVAALYVYGSRAAAVLAWLEGRGQALDPGPSDVDIGVRPNPGASFLVENKVRLAIALEDLLDVDRVDLVCLPDADPFVLVQKQLGPFVTALPVNHHSKREVVPQQVLCGCEHRPRRTLVRPR